MQDAVASSSTKLATEGDTPARARSIGAKIKGYRLAEGLTLKALAERSGVSIANISKIENGKISGGFETIYRIARGLGVLVTEIIVEDGDGEEHIVVHRRSKTDVHPTALYDYFPQAFRSSGALNPYLMVSHTRKVPERLDWSIHEGEEVVVVLSGTIDLYHGDAAPLRLATGDSACFESGRRHCFVCVSREPARILSVATRGPDTRTRGRLNFSP